MLKHIKKIIVLAMAFSIAYSLKGYAKYNLRRDMNIVSLYRDVSEIIYSISKSSEEYTNQNVLLNISTNKEIEDVDIDGFELSEDKKKLIKVFEENESGTVVLEDISGNRKEVNYEVNNIDKINPIIEGVENGRTYNTIVKPQYTDNIGIKSVSAQKFGTKVNIQNYSEYYDTSKYKGLDATKNTIYVRITEVPKNTKKLQYYINNRLVETTEEKEYTYTNLNPNTNYNIMVKAIDNDGNVLNSATKQIKTRNFSTITANKVGNTFSATLTGLEPQIKHVAIKEFSNSDRTKITYLIGNIQPDRSVSATLVATNITSTVEKGYYYLQFVLKDDMDHIIEDVYCNIIFNTTYQPNNDEIDPYNITQNGSYIVTAIDLAGNETSKEFTISK